MLVLTGSGRVVRFQDYPMDQRIRVLASSTLCLNVGSCVTVNLCCIDPLV